MSPHKSIDRLGFSAISLNLSQICDAFQLVRTLCIITSHNCVLEDYWKITGYCQNHHNVSVLDRKNGTPIAI